MILSGLLTVPLRAWSPFLIASICSMPEATLPQIVYCPSRNGAGAKHDEELAVGAVRVGARAIETVPRTCFSFENSALSLLPEPPVPVPVGSPVCAMKPSMTR